ncbi:MAG: hypothetical protein AAF664_13035 [Planctomycetota bacterium]
MKLHALLGIAALLVAMPATAQTSLHDELIDGDLSGAISSPTGLSIVTSGDFSISGSVVDSDQDDTFAPGGAIGDYDVFTVTLASGLQIDALTLDAFGGGGQAFIGVQEGTELTVNTATNGNSFPAVASGFTLVDSSEVGENLLTDLGLGVFGSVPAFSLPNPVSSGDYTFAFQNTGTNTNTYTLGFQVSAVPEPAAGSLAILLVPFAMRRRRR